MATSPSTTSDIRQNYAEECEAAVNRHVNGELQNSYCYEAMAFHFDRDDVALPGFHKFFEKSSAREKGQAEKLMKYQNERGGRIVLQDIKRPGSTEWASGVIAMKAALKMEQHNNESLIHLHSIAERNDDSQLCDFLEGEFLKPKVEIIKLMGDYIAKLERVGPGLGEYTFDRETLQH